MAMITITGYPCSGKTFRANQLRSYFESQLRNSGPFLKVVVVSDDSLDIRRDAYDNSHSEKPARGALQTAITRNLSQDTILIIDAPNYIKGFRYQLYCAARELRVRVATLYTAAPPTVCAERNAARDDLSTAYAPATLDNLIARYEEPSSMVRWDSPLFVVPWSDPDIPGKEIWDVITSGVVKPPNTGTQAVPKAPTDALRTLESTTTSLVSAILETQANSPSPGGPTPLPLLERPVTLPMRSLALSELQRLKRQFATVHKKAITLGTTEKGSVDWSETSVASKFATYLEDNLRP